MASSPIITSKRVIAHWDAVDISRWSLRQIHEFNSNTHGGRIIAKSVDSSGRISGAVIRYSKHLTVKIYRRDDYSLI